MMAILLRNDGPYSRPALLLLVSAVLHLLVIVLSLGGYVLPMLVGAVVWVVIAAGLQRNWRWLAYLAFLLAIIGGIVAMSNGMATSGIVAIAFWSMMALDWVAAAFLFLLIWRDPLLPQT